MKPSPSARQSRTWVDVVALFAFAGAFGVLPVVLALGRHFAPQHENVYVVIGATLLVVFPMLVVLMVLRGAWKVANRVTPGDVALPPTRPSSVKWPPLGPGTV